MSILTLQNIAYSYADGTKNVLSGANYLFEQGKFYAIVGNSGTGKSTLLGLLAGLDKPTSGQILFKNKDIVQRGYSYHRKHHVSLVFQNYNLIDYLTPLENLKLVNPRATTKTLRTMGLDDEHINRNVMKLSGHRVTKRDNKCVIVVTHSKRLAKTADIVLRLKAGKLVEQDNTD